MEENVINRKGDNMKGDKGVEAGARNNKRGQGDITGQQGRGQGIRGEKSY